jgi:hypothetical protein
MHGRKKPTQPQSEAELGALGKKTKVLAATVDSIINKKKEKEYSSDTLLLTGQILRNTPDFYSVWNLRREILISQKPKLSAVVDEKIVDDPVVKEELKLTEDAIKKNPKSCMSSFWCG